MIDAQQIAIVTPATPLWQWFVAAVAVPLGAVVLAWVLRRRK